MASGLMALLFCVLVGEVEKLQCRVPSDDDAAVRASQVLQLTRLVQASQHPVSVLFVKSVVHLPTVTDTPICTIKPHIAQ